MSNLVGFIGDCPILWILFPNVPEYMEPELREYRFMMLRGTNSKAKFNEKIPLDEWETFRLAYVPDGKLVRVGNLSEPFICFDDPDTHALLSLMMRENK
jgi:hypothetical protein